MLVEGNRAKYPRLYAGPDGESQVAVVQLPG